MCVCEREPYTHGAILRCRISGFLFQSGQENPFAGNMTEHEAWQMSPSKVRGRRSKQPAHYESGVALDVHLGVGGEAKEQGLSVVLPAIEIKD